MSSTIGGGDDGGGVVPFPKSAEERRALRKAKKSLERQRLINVFIDETNGQGLFHTPDGVAYADLIIGGHRETWPVRSRQFRHAYLRYLQRQQERLIAANDPIMAMMVKASMAKNAVSATIDDFETRAIVSPTTREVHVRVAEYKGELYIDLCNDEWQAMRVTSTKWSVVDAPPVRFQRTTGMLELPHPARGGKVETLRDFLNCTVSDFSLVVAYLLAALYPKGPYPILILYGVQGAAKTAFLRKLRKLIDPHTTETTPLPGSGRDLFISARNSHAQAYENVSKLSDAMSDTLCRLSTGGGYRTRKLFKDADEVHFRGGRPIMFEGIANVVSKPDLQDRAIIMQLEDLAGYKQERELDPEFERKRPAIFGALLDMMVRGLAMLPVTKLISPPRLADFAHWAVACGVQDFETLYAANRQNAINVMLSHDPVAKAVRVLVAKQKFTGDTEDLLDQIGPSIPEIKSTKKLSNELRRLIPALRSVGVDVTFHQRQAEWRGFTIELKK
jgi:hypothetical protein